MGPFESVDGPAGLLGLASSNGDLLCIIIHKISTPMRRSPSTPPTTPPTIGPISVRLSLGAAADEVLDGELEEVAVGEVVEEDVNGTPLRMPLVAICWASVLLNCILVQSLASSWAHSGICTPPGIGHSDVG